MSLHELLPYPQSGGTVFMECLMAVLILITAGFFVFLVWRMLTDWIQGEVMSGTVVEMYHTEEGYTNVLVGKIMVPQHHDASWTVVIAGTRAKSGKPGRSEHNVSQKVYESLKKGDLYTVAA
jgi:hypothetical protein